MVGGVFELENRMTIKPKKILKAYDNPVFLKSGDATTIRLLSEYLEPLSRFKREGIEDTIVFFGSARVTSRKIALANLRRAKEKMKQTKRASKTMASSYDSALTQVSMSAYYEDAVELSSMLTKWSKSLSGNRHFVVCSGGGPGIMEAANKGARVARGRSIGLNISLPFEQFSNRYVSDELSFEFHYFFMRKLWFMRLARALVMFPGGFGTMDELMEILTLVQTQKITRKLPILLYGSKYWKEVLNIDAMVKHQMISKDDANMFTILDTPKEAFTYLRDRLSSIYFST